MQNYILFIIVLLSLNSCNNNTVLFEDDFENYTVKNIPSAPWKKEGKGNAFIDTTRAYSGKKSVHFTTAEGFENRAFISIDHIFPLIENKYYGSLKMYIEEASPNGIHWTMIQSTGKVKGADFTSEIRYGGQHHKRLMANYDTQGVKSDCWKHSQAKIPEKEWFSLQWMFDGNGNTMKLWLNDVLVESLIVINQGEGCVSEETNGQWRFPIFENVFIGWVDYQTGGGTRNIWVDDVVISLEKNKNK